VTPDLYLVNAPKGQASEFCSVSRWIEDITRPRRTLGERTSAQIEAEVDLKQKKRSADCAIADL
jgi:hypothetical protein